MKVKCKNGLCDRLGMIFSYLHKARSIQEQLYVCWPIDQECNGHFLDVFNPIKDMIFTEDDSKLDFQGFKPHQDYNSVIKFIYKDLMPIKGIQNQITKIKHQMGNYSALHIRRTDKLDPIKSPLFVNTEDWCFFNFIETQKHDKIFLACDCRDTQDIYINRYGDRIVCSSLIEPSNNLRQTSLSLAVTDLFLCIHSNNFFGTNHSGFTKFIKQFREKRKQILI